MSRWSSIVVLFCVGALIAESLAAPTDEPIIVRSKRQQCRCVKNPNGGLTCSCAKGPANGSSSSTSNQIGTGVQYDVPQSTDIANQLTQMSQQSTGLGTARCGCIQIVFQGAPQYNCQCGDQNGNPLPTSTTMAPTTSTTTSTTTTTTTPAPTTTSTTPSTTTTQLPVSYPNSQNNGACNCIMISITSPQTAQYQCQCAQPQQQQAQYAETYDYTQTYTVPPTTTTTPAPTTPSTTTTTTVSPITSTQQVYADAPSATQYPLTTTCVMYVNVPTTACSCLPQYDQCAQNVCCLKAKYRSYKKTEEQSPSTIDMLMNVLQTIKTKWE